jgi:outer membrane protein with beta-barrel domain
MRVRTTLTVAALTAACFMAPSAQADWILTPYAGIVFGGDLGIEDNDNLDLKQGHSVYGLGLGYMGDSALGFEFDFGYSPDFFGTEESIVPENNLTTLMGNLVLNAPLGSSGRVYVSAGGGLMKSSVNDAGDLFDVSRNDFGVDAGAGLILPLGERFGVRGDVRYFRNIGDPEPDDEFDLDFGSFDFWRATAGLSINF